MPAPSYDERQFQKAIMALLPTGPIWRREPDSTLGRLHLILARVYARNTVRAGTCLDDVFPGTSSSLLPEWEASVGLPDPCTGPVSDVGQRRGLVVGRLTDQGGSSPAYYIALAGKAGFTIAIEEFAPARACLLRAGQAVNCEDWAHAWRVHAPETTVQYFCAGEGTAGAPLASWGNRVLECLIRHRAPAHTVLLFAYDMKGNNNGLPS